MCLITKNPKVTRAEQDITVYKIFKSYKDDSKLYGMIYDNYVYNLDGLQSIVPLATFERNLENYYTHHQGYHTYSEYERANAVLADIHTRMNQFPNPSADSTVQRVIYSLRDCIIPKDKYYYFGIHGGFTNIRNSQNAAGYVSSTLLVGKERSRVML